MSLPYSSVPATNAIASRLVRQVSDRNAEFIYKLAFALKPLRHEIANRGKLPKNQMQREFANAISRMADTANLVYFDSGQTKISSLRSNPQMNARMLFAGSNSEKGPDGNTYVDFMAVDLKIHRNKVTLRFDTTDFMVSTHLLSRYMQRDRNHAENFLANIVDVMKAGMMLSCISPLETNGRLALPHEKGMVMGEVCVIKENDIGDPFWPREIEYQGSRCDSKRGECSRLDEVRYLTLLKTFVDNDSMVGVKEALLREIRAWERQHAEGIDFWWQAVVFGSARIPMGHTIEQMQRATKAAYDAATSMLRSPTWQKFANT